MYSIERVSEGHLHRSSHQNNSLNNSRSHSHSRTDSNFPRVKPSESENFTPLESQGFENQDESPIEYSLTNSQFSKFPSTLDFRTKSDVKGSTFTSIAPENQSLQKKISSRVSHAGYSKNGLTGWHDVNFFVDSELDSVVKAFI